MTCHCNGNCPTPDACELPEVDYAGERTASYLIVGVWMALTVIFCALAGLVAGVLF